LTEPAAAAAGPSPPNLVEGADAPISGEEPLAEAA
jgi:hypothetical protein